MSRVIVEQVSAMPPQGVTSTFRFGHACGAIYGAVVALGLRVSFVAPERWQQHHRGGKGPDDAVRKVLQLYPTLHEHLQLKRATDAPVAVDRAGRASVMRQRAGDAGRAIRRRGRHR